MVEQQQAPLQIAYLILAHDHPAQLGRLVARLQGPGVRCYLHIDAKTSDATFAAMQAAMPANADVQFIARRACGWGGFSLVVATLDLLAAAQAVGFDWAILLSGADYPVKTHAQIAARLGASDALGYLDVRSQAQFDVRHRWQAFHPESLNGKPLGKALQKLQRGARRLGLHRRLPTPLAQVWAGSQWWCLSADACKALTDFVDRNPSVVRFFQTTSVPDEMFVQTVLMATCVAPHLVKHNHHAIRWQADAWSPATFETEDVAELVSGPTLFARKFTADGNVTALIDQTLATRQSVA
ncbi:beta-1,6-N-acetylglucosaminyltransferase [Silvimonas sp.]|uniref:beta-1,6-N-acetylglucosaminyltransferase n=1 Tax=Silvimonas sp. TaxID=2650811 RepID=UPI0028411535|nr:beta-1,6-N-acetylglucosaminyltransferase [Silvimonas sp.]MDR3429377.1 beta-1,6-N-acetylglucosaminyltransferase [Silvimonas sp.]